MVCLIFNVIPAWMIVKNVSMNRIIRNINTIAYIVSDETNTSRITSIS